MTTEPSPTIRYATEKAEEDAYRAWIKTHEAIEAHNNGGLSGSSRRRLGTAPSYTLAHNEHSDWTSENSAKAHRGAKPPVPLPHSQNFPADGGPGGESGSAGVSN